MIVTIQCPHCRARTYVDTHWITNCNDRINCNGCRNSYRAHLWEIVGTNADDRVKVIFT